MRYPAFLPEGGRIGYIAPSFGAADEWYGAKFDAALKAFEDRGYTSVLGPNCRLDNGIGKSNTPEQCAAEINDFFINDRSDVILSVGGGETMCEDLTHVDFDAIAKAEPKWFMGYSDNTNLTFTLPVLCDTAAIYGPCATAFGQREWHASLSDALRILQGQADAEDMTGMARSVSARPDSEGQTFTLHNYPAWEGGKVSAEEITEETAEEPDPCAPWELTEPSCFTAYAPGSTEPTAEKVEFSGRLLGGCIDCLQTLCGTRFDRVREFAEKYKEEGILWFLEACDLNPMSMRRVLWQLKEAGWFQNAKGFIIGRPLHFREEMMGMNRTNAVLGALSDLNVPILLDTDLGHLPPAIPYISGAVARVTAEAGRMTVSQILR